MIFSFTSYYEIFIHIYGKNKVLKIFKTNMHCHKKCMLK